MLTYIFTEEHAEKCFSFFTDYSKAALESYAFVVVIHYFVPCVFCSLQNPLYN